MITENYIKINKLINQHSDLINKIKTERINNNWVLDVFLKSLSLHIFISNIIKVDVNQSLNQYVLDFTKDERIFKNFNQFEIFFLEVVDSYSEKTEGLYIEHYGKEYLCDIEITSIDTDRQMGTETHYEVSFTDGDGEKVIVADVREYPMMSFDVNIYDDEFITYLQSISQYFFNKSIV